MNPKYFFQIFSICGKKEKFDANFESVEKVGKKITLKKLEG